MEILKIENDENTYWIGMGEIRKIVPVGFAHHSWVKELF